MDNKFKPVPFWSWNGELQENKLTDQIQWMYDSGIGGFFMHARGGLTTPYLGDKWFSCVDACLKKAKELGMMAYAYDENGWPSGFGGGKLLENEADRDCYLTHSEGPYDSKAFASYDISTDRLIRVNSGDNVLNVYCHTAVSTSDILNEDVVRRFIEITHEQYKKADKYGNLQGFFTDEPQYQRWQSPYTHCLEGYFKKEFNEDIKDKLGLLFVEKEGYRSFRYKYWKAMQSLMLNAFSKQIYEWCNTNGYKLTGHYIEESTLAMQMVCCAGIMPHYEYEHIPGMDWLGRPIFHNDLPTKQLGSACAQLGKKQVLTESFAMAGWDATPEELKHNFEWQAVTGNVSLLCHHLLPYSEKGQRKRDYPEHYSNINPWAEKDFKVFNDTISEISVKISTSSEEVRVAVLHPIRSCYFNYKRDDCRGSIKELEEDLSDTVKMLAAFHIPYHFIDETLLEKHGKNIKNTIKLGLYSYDYLILPLIYTMDKNTEKVLKEYVENGGKVLLLKDKPTYVEGEPFSYPYLKSNITLEDIIKIKPFVSSKNDNIRISFRRDDQTGQRFFYIVNLGDKTSFEVNGKTLIFNKWESRFINENELQSDSQEKKNYVELGREFIVKKPIDNYLTLDLLRYSKDGISFSEQLPHMGVFSILLKERYKGDIYLKYEFDVKDIPTVCSSLIENQNIIDVTVNGHKVEKVGSVLEEDLWEYKIADKLQKGTNEIVVRLDFFQNEDVYFALFGEGVTETLLNCLTYPTTIEAIYLKGNFGVYGDFVKGHQDDTYLATKFFLDKPKDKIESLILDGYPFVRGKIELEQDIEINNDKPILLIPGRYQLIKLSINDNYIGQFMFDHEIDISKYAKAGMNKINMELVISNRNLLGPFHTFDSEEPIGVGPFSFERRGTWTNGKSNYYRDSYSFVKTII